MRKEFSPVLGARVGRSREEPGADRALGRGAEESVGAASGSFRVRGGPGVLHRLQSRAPAGSPLLGTVPLRCT